MKPGILIIFSGLPGTGKSTLAAKLASALGATYLRIDTIEQGLRDICGITQVNGMGYQLAQRIVQENLLTGNMVIADSVNPWELTRKEWNAVAEDVGANFVNIEVVCSNSEDHKKRVESRGPSAPGLKNLTWKEVLDRDYHPWTGERRVLDTSGKDIENCLEELISILKDKGIRK